MDDPILAPVVEKEINLRAKRMRDNDGERDREKIKRETEREREVNVDKQTIGEGNKGASYNTEMTKER